MIAIITPDEIRAKCRNAHPVDALVLLRCAEEIERLRGELEWIMVQGIRGIAPGWVGIPEVEWDSVYHHKAPADFARHFAHELVDRLRGVLELIRDNGGCTTEEGLTCNGSWCGEQARRDLEETK